MSGYTFKQWLKEHPIKSSRGVDIQTPQTAVLKHSIFNSVDILSYPNIGSEESLSLTLQGNKL